MKNTSRTRKKIHTQPPTRNSKRSGAHKAKTTCEAAKFTITEDAPPALTEKAVKTEEHLLDVETVYSMHFDGATKATYTLLQEELLKYVPYYT